VTPRTIRRTSTGLWTMTLVAVTLLVGLYGCASAPSIDPVEARAIAKEAYIYGYPVIENYKVLYANTFDPSSPEYKAPFNTVFSDARVYTPADKTVVTPNSDTPYSFLWMDLRAEPIVLTVPAMDSNRYFSIQLIDLYTHNFAYIGTRTTGNGGGTYMLAGPAWKGETPEGIDLVIPCETELALAIYRTQLFSPSDLDQVKQIQDGYKAMPLSAFLGIEAPAPAPAVDWPALKPGLTDSLAFFGYLNFLLHFAPAHPSEQELLTRLARIGVKTGAPFDTQRLSTELKQALEAGMADAWKDFAALQEQINAGQYNSGDMFGTREFLKNNYLFRMAGAKIGLYGNSREEAMYPLYLSDADGQPLDASSTQYPLRFEKGQAPPAAAFWSLTMYDGRTQLLIDNPLNRYLINSPMLPDLKRDKDGSVTIYIQKDSPGAGKESNWLPAPDGPFYVVLRLYLPKPEVFDGTWAQPPIQKAG